jgi:hypothetical protein
VKRIIPEIERDSRADPSDGEIFANDSLKETFVTPRHLLGFF